MKHIAKVLGAVAIILSILDISFWIVLGRPVFPQFGYLVGFDILSIVFMLGILVGVIACASIFLIKPIRLWFFKHWEKEDKT